MTTPSPEYERGRSAAIGTFEWVDRSIIEQPQSSPVEVLRDRWWMVNAAGQVAFYRWSPKAQWRSPLCNPSRTLVEKLMPPEGVGSVHIPVAFVPHRCDLLDLLDASTP